MSPEQLRERRAEELRRTILLRAGAEEVARRMGITLNPHELVDIVRHAELVAGPEVAQVGRI